MLTTVSQNNFWDVLLVVAMYLAPQGHLLGSSWKAITIGQIFVAIFPNPKSFWRFPWYQVGTKRWLCFWVLGLSWELLDPHEAGVWSEGGERSGLYGVARFQSSSWELGVAVFICFLFPNWPFPALGCSGGQSLSLGPLRGYCQWKWCKKSFCFFPHTTHPGSDNWAETESSKGQIKWMKPKRGVKVAESISHVLRDYLLLNEDLEVRPYFCD